MAKLTARRRKRLDMSQFGLEDARKYPVNDRAHAANAKARATQQAAAGNLSAEEKSEIDAKANAVLKGSK